ncbi:Histone-lysine N-methyltransferase trithorax-like protein [Fagus crenata]
MKREGRQHGLVRTYRFIPSSIDPIRYVNEFHSPPTAGLFTKVPSEPTNHSKFTGKCGTPRCTECHMNPTFKSKNKTKGTQKLNSHDMVLNTRLITCNVMYGHKQPGLSFFGFSATNLLALLTGTIYYDEVYDPYDPYPYDHYWELW